MPGFSDAGSTPMSSSGPVTILLVEDERSVREILAEALRAEDYLVLEAEGGEEALSIANRLSGEISLVITDVFMPGMNGAQLATQIREAVGPTAPPVLYMSGYSAEMAAECGVPVSESFLQKPCRLDELFTRVRESLQGGAPDLGGGLAG